MSDDTYTRAELLAAIALRPCHVTGMHEPDHHLKYVCDIQRADQFDRLLALLGVEESELPRELHPECGWCHRVPTQEVYRERLRQTHAWAGVPTPADLAAPAPDAPCYDAPRRDVLRAVKKAPKGTGAAEGWVPWDNVREYLGFPRHDSRTFRPLEALIAEGVVEHKFIQQTGHVRLARSRGDA